MWSCQGYGHGEIRHGECCQQGQVGATEIKSIVIKEFVKGEHGASWNVLEIKMKPPEKPAIQADNMKADAVNSRGKSIPSVSGDHVCPRSKEKVTQES